MIRSFGLLAVLAGFSATTAQEAQKPTLKVIGFLVVKVEEGVPKRSQDREQGTRVVVRVDVPGRHIISFDTKASKVDYFSDDKNTDLTATEPGPKSLVKIDRTGLQVAKPNDLTFHAPLCPTAGATKVRIKGSVVAIVGKTEKETEKKDFTGNADLGFGTIAELKGTFGGTFLGTYVGDKPLKSISATDADGKPVTCTITQAVVFGGAKKPAYRYSIRADRGVPRNTLRVKYFEGTEEVTVPVDLEVGPGF